MQLVPGPPGLEASTISLGYRGGGICIEYICEFITLNLKDPVPCGNIYRIPRVIDGHVEIYIPSFHMNVDVTFYEYKYFIIFTTTIIIISYFS